MIFCGSTGPGAHYYILKMPGKEPFYIAVEEDKELLVKRLGYDSAMLTEISEEDFTKYVQGRE